MVKMTSVAVYHAIRDRGLLKGRRLEVLTAIIEGGPGTQTEIVQRILAKKGTGRFYSYTPRFAELERRKVIVETHTRPCSSSGHEAGVWEFTGNLPEEYKPEHRREFWVVIDLTRKDGYRTFNSLAEAQAYVNVFLVFSEQEIIRVAEAKGKARPKEFRACK